MDSSWVLFDFFYLCQRPRAQGLAHFTVQSFVFQNINITLMLTLCRSAKSSPWKPSVTLWYWYDIDYRWLSWFVYITTTFHIILDCTTLMIHMFSHLSFRCFDPLSNHQDDCCKHLTKCWVFARVYHILLYWTQQIHQPVSGAGTTNVIAVPRESVGLFALRYRCG